jgi:ribosomal protein L23
VAILKVPAKRSFVRGRITKGKTGRKAYVYLKKGDKIENL